jgi:glycosyltransferase involved in cell wall biosynthesis
MKIALVIDRIEPFYRGGYERRAWELAKRLAKRHETTVFTSAPSSQVLEGVQIVAVRPQVAYFKPDGFRDLRANLIYALSLLKLLKGEHSFDVIDCNATPFLHIFSSYLLARRWRAALLVTAHEALADTMHGYFRARRSPVAAIASSSARLLYYSSQRLADRIIAPSLITASNLRNEGFTAVDVCIGGVPRVYSPKHRSAGRAVFVGRFVPHKHVDLVIKAFAVAARQHGSVRSLTLIGDGPERNRLESLAVDLGVRSLTSFLGDVPDDRKWRILVDEADVFISASPREGIAIAVLEALATGNPAIIAYTPDRFQQGAVEYLRDGHNGIVTDGSEPALASALHRLFSDPDLYESMSRNAIDTARDYTWDSAVSTLERIYEGAIATRAQPKAAVSFPAVETTTKSLR